MTDMRGIYLVLIVAFSLSACGYPDQSATAVSSKTFALAPCGDGILDDGEQCDDGNEIPGDGCDAQCQLNPFPINASGDYPRAGFGAGEGDVFTVSLAIESQLSAHTHDGMGGCPGDSLLTVYSGEEPVAFDDDGGASLCSAIDLVLPAGDYRVEVGAYGGQALPAYTLTLLIGGIVCGDGVISGTEECDDGNIIDGDGCDASCHREPRCGDGFLDAGEACDDNNLADGDGCDAQCALEGVAPGPGELVITEIMKSASAHGNYGEWFEIYNATDHDLQLNGLQVHGGRFVTFTIEGSLFARAGEYLVLGPAATPMQNGGIIHDYAFDEFFWFDDANDSLAIYDQADELIDEVHYTWGREDQDWPRERGRSIALHPGTLDTTLNDYGLRWCLGTVAIGGGDFGTPGEANPPCDACGDGVVNGRDICDDGNLIDADGCDNNCHPTPVCGNGFTDIGEQCDDGNQAADDGCNSECLLVERVIDGSGAYVTTGSAPGLVNVFTLNLDLAATLTFQIGDPGDDCLFGTNLNLFDGTGTRIARSSFQNWCRLEIGLAPGEYRLERHTRADTSIPPSTLNVSWIPVICGDGQIVAPETCDDGNVEAGDGCNAECQLECGDGVRSPIEACDDGNREPNDGCGPTCEIEGCGDGFIQIGEECDDGNDAGGDGCVACRLEVVAIDGPGDYPLSGFADRGFNTLIFSLPLAAHVTLTATNEAGDCIGGVALFLREDTLRGEIFGITSGREPCSQLVRDLPVGDFMLTIHEESYGELPPYVLKVEIEAELCGDGVISGAEECDDGNLDPDDGCSAWCVGECGDGRVSGVETCDDGNRHGGDGCNANCQLEICGNGIEEYGEECDDGNTVNGDGCTADCLDEVVSVCGNGRIEGEEECEGQSCDALCTFDTYSLIKSHYEGRHGLATGGRDTYIFIADSQIELTLSTSEVVDCPRLSGLRITPIGSDEPIYVGDGDACAQLEALELPAGTYALTLDHVGAPTHYRITMDVVTPIDGGGIFTTSSAWQGNDIFTFHLDAAEEVWLNVIPNYAGACPRPRMQLSHGDLNFTWLSDRGDCWIYADRLPAGEYRLRAQGVAYRFVARFEGECGDGVVNVGESCDDTNLVAGDGCDETCLAERCGDGQTDADEECDDGNTDDGDGCDSICQLEGECGDGIVDWGEACDDGNADALTCDSVCTPSLTAFESGLVESIGNKGADDETFTFVVDMPSVLSVRLSLPQQIFNVPYNTCSLTLDDQEVYFSNGCSLSQDLEPGEYEWTMSGPEALNFPIRFELSVDVTQGGLFSGATTPGGDDLYLISRGAQDGPIRAVFTLTEGCDTVETLIWSHADQRYAQLWQSDNLEQLDDCRWTGYLVQSAHRIQVVGGPDGAEYTLDVSFASEKSLVITEIMKDPDVVIDGFGEWFELTNVGLEPVDLFGHTFRDFGGRSFTVDESVIVGVGEQVVLGRWNIPLINGGVELDYAYGHGMVLGNRHDQILVYAPDGTLLDSVQYGTGWPRSNAVGHAIQFDGALNAATEENTQPSTWCVAQSVYGAGDFGTPGAPNDPCP